MNYILLSAFVGGCRDFKNKHGMKHKTAPIIESIYHKFSETEFFPSGVKISNSFGSLQ